VTSGIRIDDDGGGVRSRNGRWGRASGGIGCRPPLLPRHLPEVKAVRTPLLSSTEGSPFRPAWPTEVGPCHHRCCSRSEEGEGHWSQVRRHSEVSEKKGHSRRPRRRHKVREETPVPARTGRRACHRHKGRRHWRQTTGRLRRQHSFSNPITKQQEISP
jgi:hypothetical protein